jgi:hypothetical protein
MKANRTCWLLAGAVGLVALAPLSVRAGGLYNTNEVKGDKSTLPAATDVKELAAYPTSITLRGSDASQQLVLTANLAGAKLSDLSGDVKYEVADAKVVRVTTSGRVIPLADGTTTITARYGERSVTVPVTTQSMTENLPINFVNQIVPIFTKMGCNAGGCHGKSGGQNGFAISLLGFVPEMDYAALVKEARGRRLLPAAPEHSLLLLKATGSMAHGGGKRIEVGSDEYKMIRRWIAAGTPYGKADDPVVTKISVYPEERSVPRSGRQQLAVYAHYSDGTVEDVTRRAQYESNDQEIAVVDGAGLVRTLDLSGQAGVMARYQGQVAVFRATVPLGVKVPTYTFERRTVVDQYTHKQWQKLGIVPSELSSDEIFLRRAYADITGTLPTPAQVREFLADNSPDKRARLIDRLLDTPEYSYFFANRWADILRVKRGNQQNRAFGTFAFHGWIRESLAADKSYDQFVREILGAVGDETKCPPVVWYRDLQKPEQFVDDTAQLFLGVRMACAQCHHHPYEKWSQDDYWGLAAFFGRVTRKNVPTPGVQQNNQTLRQVIYSKGPGVVTNKRTGKPAVMRPPDGDAVKPPPDEDPRHLLIDWMVDAKNPFFARAVVNRYWAHFFGRGLVDPVDDMRVTNPPSDPDLLDALAKDFVEHKYSLKHLVRTICNSRTYQLSAVPNEYNRHDKRAFARYYPRRMSAEVLFDAVSQVTGAPAGFQGLPADRHAPNRAIMLPDESYKSYFLDVFGRPQRISACECERVTDANLAQALHLLNSNEIQGKLARPGGRAEQMAKDPRPDAEKVEELFLWALGRPPNAAQLDLALANIAQHPRDKRVAYENILWALINTKEFIFVQ